MRTGSRGFTYLWLLFVLAAASAIAGMAVERWSQSARRQLEQEQIFRGREIASAIAAYRAASAPEGKAWPRSLQDLLDDTRFEGHRRYLRRAYIDPLTGRTDWVLLTDDEGGIHGLHSRSTRPALILRDLQRQADTEAKVSERLFGEMPGPAASAPPPRQGGRAAHS